jgi:hypothetical protein
MIKTRFCIVISPEDAFTLYQTVTFKMIDGTALTAESDDLFAVITSRKHKSTIDMYTKE